MTKEQKKIEPDNGKIIELENKIAELTAGWQRTQADFLNYKKQVECDRINLVKLANADLIERILPVLDNFQLAAKHVPMEIENNNWVGGITLIKKQLETALKNEGLERIECLGQQFDPRRHEALEDVESARPAGEIVEEVSPGYTLSGLVLRPAKVKISKAKTDNEQRQATKEPNY
ncbi:MAG: nucleotide exchange factor GrpE [Patescibacteria group bacterium]